MGTYCTITSMETYLMGANVSNTATGNIITDLIVDAENEINKYVSKRYDVSAWDSLGSTPPLVTSWCKFLTAGYYHEAVSGGGKEKLALSKKLLDRVMPNLKDVRDGDMNIIDSSGSDLTESDSPSAIFSNLEDFHPTFDEDDATKWKVDPDKLTEIASDRS